jgi:hypothetical protein
MLDFVDPAGTGRRCLRWRRQTQFDNPQPRRQRDDPGRVSGAMCELWKASARLSKSLRLRRRSVAARNDR